MLKNASKSLISHLSRLRIDKNYRELKQRCIITGYSMINDLSITNKFQSLIVCDQNSIPLSIQTNKIFQIDYNTLKKITGQPNPQSILAEIELPKSTLLNHLKRIIAVENLQDPGNLGTIIRSTEGLGWDGIFIIEPNVDLFHERTISASSGSIFRLKYSKGSWNDLDQLINQSKYECLIADLKGEDVNQIDRLKSILLVVGNEGNGISEQAKQRGKSISIPMKSNCNSLNVSIAASILMFTLRSN